MHTYTVGTTVAGLIGGVKKQLLWDTYPGLVRPALARQSVEFPLTGWKSERTLLV